MGLVFWIVFKPLMPLGVEHVTPVAQPAVAQPVFKPLMPLGVEHGYPNALKRYRILGV